MPSAPVEDLARLALDGDRDAVERLVKELQGDIYGLALRMLWNREDAEDATQEILVRTVTRLSQFDFRSRLKTWVYRILVNTAKRRGTREGRTVPMSSLLPTDEDHGPTVDPARFLEAGHRWAGHWREFPAAWPSPEQTALSGEVHSQVAAAVAELPDRQRIVITLRDVEGYTSAEVREILDISVANQRVLLHRARAFVRGRLESYFATVEAERIGGEAVP